jgi:hypothetical protein
LLEAGVTLVEVGSPQTTAQYEQLRQEAVRRSAGTQDPLAAERLIRTSLLLPASPDMLQALDLPARTIEKSLSGTEAGAKPASNEAPWRLVALALMEYRRGRLAAAAQWCQSLPAADTNSARIAAIRLIQAMSCQQLGQKEEAASALEQAGELIGAKYHTGLTAGRGPDGYWFDWAMAGILQREADGLIKPQPIPDRTPGGSDAGLSPPGRPL